MYTYNYIYICGAGEFKDTYPYIYRARGPTEDEDEDMFEDKHVVSQRPTVVGERDSVNCNGPGNFAEDKPFLD